MAYLFLFVSYINCWVKPNWYYFLTLFLQVIVQLFQVLLSYNHIRFYHKLTISKETGHLCKHQEIGKKTFFLPED